MKTTTKLLAISGLHGLAASIADIILSLYIWRLLDLRAVAQFKMTELLLIPLLGFGIGWLGKYFGPKIGLALGLILFCIEIIVLLTLGEQITQHLLLIALLSGASMVCRYMSLNVLYRTAVTPKQQPPFYGNMSIVYYVLQLVFPILSGFIILRSGYTPLFWVALICSAIILLILYSVGTSNLKVTFAPQKAFQTLSKEIISLLFTQVWWGLEYAFFLTVLPILITSQFKGEFGWGIVMTGMSFLKIISSVLLLKSASKLQKQKVVRMGGVLVSIGALLYAIIPTLDYFLIILLLLQIWQVIQEVIIRPHMNALMRLPGTARIGMQEFSYILELPFMLGRMLMYSCIWLVSPYIQSPYAIFFLFLIVSMVPVNEARALQTKL